MLFPFHLMGASRGMTAYSMKGPRPLATHVEDNTITQQTIHLAGMEGKE